MNRLAHFVVRRRRAVILVWMLVLLVTAAIGSSAFSVLSTDFGAGTSTESGRVAHSSTSWPRPVASSPSSPTASTSTTRRCGDA